jgi:hypothetical protein
MASVAQPVGFKELKADPNGRVALQELAARLYGRGMKRNEVAKAMRVQLAPEATNDADRMKVARRRLRFWERQQDFRDLLYIHAVTELDLQTPAILRGVAAKGRRGRVDAARLALEITGRHNPKGESQPAQVAVVISGVPRPAQITTTNGQESITVEASEAMIHEDDEV